LHGHRLGALELADDADLHVIHQQRQLAAITDVFEGLRHRDAKSLFPANPFTRRLFQPEAGTGFTDIGGGSKQKFRADGRAVAPRNDA
jgi:hypothetical protein